jgi:hypothetical protein
VGYSSEEDVEMEEVEQEDEEEYDSDRRRREDLRTPWEEAMDWIDQRMSGLQPMFQFLDQQVWDN